MYLPSQFARAAIVVAVVASATLLKTVQPFSWTVSRHRPSFQAIHYKARSFLAVDYFTPLLQQRQASSLLLAKADLRTLLASEVDLSWNNLDTCITKIDEFLRVVSHGNESINCLQTEFIQFTIQGQSKKKKVTHEGAYATSTDNPPIGSLFRIQGRRIAMIKKGNNMIQITFKYHGATDIVKNWPLNELAAILKLCFFCLVLCKIDYNNTITGQKKQLIFENVLSEWEVSPDQVTKYIEFFLSQNGTLESLSLETVKYTWELTGWPLFCLTKKIKHTLTSNSSSASLIPLVQPHDRQKQVPLVNTKANFLQALGLTDAFGMPRAKMSSKLRQCQKFVEIVDNLITQVMTTKMLSEGHPSNNVTKVDGIDIIDMGCGRGYLTFSVHSFLYNKYSDGSKSERNETKSISSHQIQVNTRGIEVRPALVKEISGIAHSLRPAFDGLTFRQGTIQDYLSKTENARDSLWDKNVLRVLIALHACDTATDDAIWSGILRDADVMVVAPCCHQELRPQLDRYTTSFVTKQTNPPHPLADVWRHNTYRERLTETVTDSLRALLLEYAGYKVQVFEFIGGEHTAKNCMITAVKNFRLQTMQPLQQADFRNDMIQRICTLVAYHGIKKQKLAAWMNIPLCPDTEQSKDKRLSASSMPPL